ncbi:MAG: hypothetical protein JW849_06805 [Phycisphaerae bacterium]|nr:hypothetical protein [Phycisphaerae bacterium]
MKSILFFLVLAVMVLLGAPAGCLTVHAPEKVEVNADTNESNWGRTADKYVSRYGSGKSDKKEKKKDKHDDEDDD